MSIVFSNQSIVFFAHALNKIRVQIVTVKKFYTVVTRMFHYIDAKTYLNTIHYFFVFVFIILLLSKKKALAFP